MSWRARFRSGSATPTRSSSTSWTPAGASSSRPRAAPFPPLTERLLPRCCLFYLDFFGFAFEVVVTVSVCGHRTRAPVSRDAMLTQRRARDSGLWLKRSAQDGTKVKVRVTSFISCRRRLAPPSARPVAAMAERLAFDVEWLDPKSNITWKYQLLHTPAHETIEMYETATRRAFLKRTHMPSIKLEHLFIGATVVIFARTMRVTGYADEATRIRLAALRERCARAHSTLRAAMRTRLTRCAA